MTPFPVFKKARPASLCQLAGRWDGKTLPPDGAMAEQKIDGFRCLFFPGLDGKPGLWTRGGMPMPGASHILARLLEVEAALGGRWMIDGEFQVGGTLEATKAHYDRGHRLGDAGTFHPFDAVPLDDWHRGRCDTPLYQRKRDLSRAIDATAPSLDDWEWKAGSRGRGHGIDPLSRLPDTWLFTADDVRDEANRVWARGGEGLMLKDPTAPYVRARSDNWMKVKRSGER